MYEHWSSQDTKLWHRRHHAPRIMINTVEKPKVCTPTMIINIVKKRKNQKHIEKHVGVVNIKDHRRREWVDENK